MDLGLYITIVVGVVTALAFMGKGLINWYSLTKQQKRSIVLALLGATGILILIPLAFDYVPLGWSAITNNFNRSSALYQVDFSQGNQGWIANSAAPKWTFNDTDKVLESDGRMPCCYPPSALGDIALIAPQTISTPDYTIEARIRVIAIYGQDSSGQPPFFGLFFHGYLSGKGYLAGLIQYKPNQPNTEPLSYLLAQDNGVLTRDDHASYNLDNQWHTYWLKTQGNTYSFFVDQNLLYTETLSPYFAPGLQIGIEDYDYSLQIQNFTIYSLCTPYKDCPSS